MKKHLSILALVVALASGVQAAVIINPVSAIASSTYDSMNPDFLPVNTINGTGISDPTVIETGDTVPMTYPSHLASPVFGNMWHTDLFVFTATMTYDLGAAYNLEGFHLWNANQNNGNNLSNRGIQTANIFTSLDGINYTPLVGAPTQYIQASGSDGYLGEDYSISVSNVRYVQFDITSNWGNEAVTGISEIRFIGDAVPEPSSAALLALCGIALISVRVRQRNLRTASGPWESQ